MITSFRKYQSRRSCQFRNSTPKLHLLPVCETRHITGPKTSYSIPRGLDLVYLEILVPCRNLITAPLPTISVGTKFRSRIDNVERQIENPVLERRREADSIVREVEHA